MKTSASITLAGAVCCALLALTSNVQAQSSGTPACQSSASDIDGDGWGWENNRSCRVTTTATQSQTSSTSATSGGFPVCVSSASDPDNDGWGWENNRTCRVSASSNVTAAPATNTSTSIPVCASSNSDPDNDGWGWENNRSCRVASGTAAPSTPSTPSIIMAVGDSITHGVQGQTSYRKPLNDLLNQAGCSFRYVGSQNTNFLHSAFVSPHEGYNSHTVDEFLTGHSDAAGNNRGISNSMASFSPDVVLLHIGTNDAIRGQNISETIAELDQMIAIIFQQNPSATVLLANVIPWFRDAQAAVETLGDQIEVYEAQLNNPRVHLVDVRSGYTIDLMIDDRAHPNARGDAHIADAFFNVFDSVGLCRN